MALSINRITLALGLLISATASQSVFAHGWVEFPMARQTICHNDGGYWWPSTGDNIPNSACRAALLESGTYPFVQINEFAANVDNYNDMDAVKAQIPDGQLCSAGSPAKSGMSIPSTEWQKTEITLDNNNQIELVFNATAPHNPSYWQFYLTKPGYDHNQPLNWGDLDLVDTAGNVPVDTDKKYRIKITLPTDRSGDAILYTRWQRNDAGNEGFYNCSDITFTANGDNNGGNEGTAPPAIIEYNALGYYIPVSYPSPDIGDTVRLRTFNESGQEQVDERLVITTQNQADWAEYLALQVNDKYQDQWFVGIWHDSMNHYMYDRTNLHANQVWSKEKQSNYQLSIIKAEEPTIPPVEPPVEPPIEPPVNPSDTWNNTLEYNTGDKVQYSGKTWEAQWWTKGDQPGTTGQWGVWREISETPPTTPEEPNSSLQGWSMNSEYNEKNRVMHKGNTWEAQWWTKGDEPGTTGEWGVWKAVN